MNDWPLGGANTDLEVALDPTKEGPVTKATAFSIGAYTGGDPDQADLGPDAYRCWTNAVFAVPYDADATIAAIDTTQGVIPAGGLEVAFTFDISMDPGSYAIELKPLDANGDSTDRTAPAMTVLEPASGSGWADRPGIKSSVLTVTNRDPIALNGAAYPAAGDVSFVVYWKDAPRDLAGNALNRIATTFTAPQSGGGIGSTAAGSTGIGGGGGPSAGACSLTVAGPASAPFGGWVVLASLLGLLVVLRRRL